MKAKLLTLFSLLALLLVSTATLADGRPTGIRISRVAHGGNNNVEIDVTVPGTNSYYTLWNTPNNTTVWLDNGLGNTTQYGYPVRQLASSQFNVPLPWAIDWGDSFYSATAILSGPPGGPFRGSFQHTYLPGSYTITVGDAICCSPLYIPPPSKGLPTVTTGNAITGSYRFVSTFGAFSTQDLTFSSTSGAILAVTANTTLITGTGIPALNIYGLLAMAFVLVGAGLLVFRRPQRSAF